MKVTSKLTFDEYSGDADYKDKIPVRNGSQRMLVGDNIYSRKNGQWDQMDSHHSNPDGSVNVHNLEKDTSADAVLISNHFYYLGGSAKSVPTGILTALQYFNGRSYRVFELSLALPLISWLESSAQLNTLSGDPYDFDRASARYSGATNKISR
jgi:hypothetical protein